MATKERIKMALLAVLAAREDIPGITDNLYNLDDFMAVNDFKTRMLITDGYMKMSNNPCKEIITRILQYGGKLNSIVESLVDDSDQEYRLNGAGLKLYKSSLDGNIEVGGDQKDDYKEFVDIANAHLEAAGLQGDISLDANDYTMCEECGAYIANYETSCQNCGT